MHTFNILAQLLIANYCAFCCSSKDIKEKEKSVVYIHTLRAQLLSAELFTVRNIHPTQTTLGSNTYRVSSAGLAGLL